jgi:hypothetical protein
MEKVPKPADGTKMESGQDGNYSIGEQRLQNLMNSLKSGVKRPVVEALQLPETIEKLQTKISTSFEQSRNESFEERKKRREAQTGWQSKFYGRPLVKSFDFIADARNYFEKKRAEKEIKEAARLARLKIDEEEAQALQDLTARLRVGTRTRVGIEVPTITERVVTAFTQKPKTEFAIEAPASRETPKNPEVVSSQENPAEGSSLQEVLQRQKNESANPSLQEVLQRREQAPSAQSSSPEAGEPVSEKEYSEAMLEYMEGIQTHRSEVATQLEDAKVAKAQAEERKIGMRGAKRAFQSQIYGGSGESLAQAA